MVLKLLKTLLQISVFSHFKYKNIYSKEYLVPIYHFKENEIYTFSLLNSKLKSYKKVKMFVKNFLKYGTCRIIDGTNQCKVFSNH